MPRRHYTPEEKAEFLKRFIRSGGGAAAFCRRQKLNYQSFLKWRREAEGAKKGSAESTQFVELEVKRAEVETPPPAGAGAGPAVELLLGGGMILRIYPRQAEGRP